jgi:hypothetical protein
VASQQGVREPTLLASDAWFTKKCRQMRLSGGSVTRAYEWLPPCSTLVLKPKLGAEILNGAKFRQYVE